ncbi:hypothetical protein HPB47_007739 [Ixodes persulcatus]|uniref:Uncharacterized protein n=1 Tax=Ixodes persulcatus TaxID=34615 RepID=A0AC60P6T5_IXOPE|nr:hypothetical protein HPB47_007739 [Ixodes persulcatus]
MGLTCDADGSPLCYDWADSAASRLATELAQLHSSAGERDEWDGRRSLRARASGSRRPCRSALVSDFGRKVATRFDLEPTFEMAKKKWRLKVRQASTDVPVIKFSHGWLKSGQRLETDVYEHKETIAGRTRTRRILVSESDGVQYVGENFGEHSVRTNELCKHFIAVEDVPSGKVRLYPANLITMRPYFAPASTETSTADTTTTSYHEGADALATALGNRRKRQAVESRQRLNCLNVDESAMHSTATSSLAEIPASEQLAKTSSHTPTTTADH